MATQKEEILIALGIDSSKLQAQSNGARMVIENTLKDTANGIKNLIGINLAAVGMNLIDRLGQKLSEMFGHVMFEQTNKTSIVGVVQDMEIKAMKKAVAERDAVRKSEAAKEKARAEDMLELQREAAKLQKEADEEAKTLDEKIKDQQTSLDWLRKSIEGEMDLLQLEKDKVSLLKQEANLRQLLSEKREREAKTEEERQKKQNAINQIRQQRVLDVVGPENFPELAEIARLEKEAAEGARMGNPAARQRAATNLRIAQQMRQGIEGRIRPMMDGPAKTTERTLLEGILQKLAPTDAEGIAVRVTNVSK